MKLRVSKIDLIEDLEMNEIVSVYSGQQDACMCGCSGKYYYNPEYVEEAGERRGYEVTDDEVSKVMVNKVIRTMNARRDELEIFEGQPGEWIITLRDSTPSGRWYVAYSTTNGHEIKF